MLFKTRKIQKITYQVNDKIIADIKQNTNTQ